MYYIEKINSRGKQAQNMTKIHDNNTQVCRRFCRNESHNLKRVVCLILGAAFTQLAFAETVYLACWLQYKGDPKIHFEVKLDEESGKVTHTNSNGFAFHSDGFWAVNSIRYKQPEKNDISTVYEIDRTNLKYSRAITIRMPAGSELSDGVMASTGECEVVKAIERKI